MELIVLIVMGIVIYFYFDKRKYENSAYKKESGNGYFATRFDTGNYGEYLSFNKLESIKGQHKLVVNVYLPKDNGEITEIDLICIHETGIYVIESKNYGGWIFGNEKSKYWMQSFKTGKKEKFYNPIWQNNTHIKHLVQLLQDIEPKYFKSIIVFSERCTLKKLEVYSANTKVINRYNLTKAIELFINNSEIIFSEKRIDDIYNALKPYTHASDSIKNNHIQNIKQYKNC